MSEYIITDEQAKEILNQLPTYYVPTWLYLWVHTKYPYEPPNDWIQVREEHIGVNLPEIVRCRDCRYYHSYQDLCERLKPGIVVMGDGYCKWGERRSE